MCVNLLNARCLQAQFQSWDWFAFSFFFLKTHSCHRTAAYYASWQQVRATTIKVHATTIKVRIWHNCCSSLIIYLLWSRDEINHKRKSQSPGSDDTNLSSPPISPTLPPVSIVSCQQLSLSSGTASQQPFLSSGVTCRQPSLSSGVTSRQPSLSSGVTSQQPSLSSGFTSQQPSLSSGVTSRQPSLSTLLQLRNLINHRNVSDAKDATKWEGIQCLQLGSFHGLSLVWLLRLPTHLQ